MNKNLFGSLSLILMMLVLVGCWKAGEIVDEDVSDDPANILQNPGFEIVDDEHPTRPASWVGSTERWKLAELSKDAARTGEYGLWLKDTVFIQQRLPVVAGETYELSAWVRHDEPYEAGLKIELMGHDGKHLPDQLNINRKFKSEDTEWTHVSIQLLIPESAASANFIVRVYDSEVYFDDVRAVRLTDQ